MLPSCSFAVIRDLYAILTDIKYHQQSLGKVEIFLQKMVFQAMICDFAFAYRPYEEIRIQNEPNTVAGELKSKKLQQLMQMVIHKRFS